MLMRSLTALALMLASVSAQQIDYAALWSRGTPFDQFLNGVRSREEQWKSRFANAAIDSDTLTRARALPEKRRILAIAEDRCSDSAWAVPYIAKLAAAAPERLELRVVGRRDGSAIQSANKTPDGRLATPTIVVLDHRDQPVGVWVERPTELQSWVIKNRPSLPADDLHERMDRWYKEDAGKSTIREILAILEKPSTGGN